MPSQQFLPMLSLARRRGTSEGSLHPGACLPHSLERLQVVVEEPAADDATQVQDGRVVRGGAVQVMVGEQVIVEAEHRAVQRRRM